MRRHFGSLPERASHCRSVKGQESICSQCGSSQVEWKLGFLWIMLVIHTLGPSYDESIWIYPQQMSHIFRDHIWLSATLLEETRLYPVHMEKYQKVSPINLSMHLGTCLELNVVWQVTEFFRVIYCREMICMFAVPLAAAAAEFYSLIVGEKTRLHCVAVVISPLIKLGIDTYA